MEPVERTLGVHETKIAILEREVFAMREDIQEIKETITGVKGSWKALLAVGSILSGIFVTIGMKLWDTLGNIPLR